MIDIPTISFRVLIRMVKKFGFEPIRQKGSHTRFAHPDGRKTTIPDHGNQDVPYAIAAQGNATAAKLDAVAADLKAHRRDTEAHHPVYRVKEP